MAKHIFVTGGVVSSLGKGLTSASIGMLLERRGLRVRLQKPPQPEHRKRNEGKFCNQIHGSPSARAMPLDDHSNRSRRCRQVGRAPVVRYTERDVRAVLPPGGSLAWPNTSSSPAAWSAPSAKV